MVLIPPLEKGCHGDQARAASLEPLCPLVQAKYIQSWPKHCPKATAK